MKLLLPSLLALASVAIADKRTGDALEYHFDHTYVLIAVTDERAFLELRDNERDAFLDNVVLWSRLMPPDFEVKDVALDDNPEFIVRTRGGGTGIAETHLTVYGVSGRSIRKFGDFVVERQAQSRPEVDCQEELSGKVSYPKRNELLYRYTQVLTKGGKPVTNSITQRFLLSRKNMKYERAKKP